MTIPAVSFGSYVRDPTHTTLYFATSVKAFPNMFIFREASNSYLLITLKKTTFLNGLKQLGGAAQVLTAIERKLQFKSFPADAFAKLPGVKLERMTFAYLYIALMKLGLTEEYFRRIIGEPPSSGEAKADYKMGNAKIFFSQGMQLSRKKATSDILLKSRKVLASKGFEYLITEGIIRVRKLPPGRAGEYAVGTGELAISNEARFTSDMVHTVCHELAHKLEDKYLSDSQKKIIAEVFSQNLTTAGKAEIDKKKLKDGAKLNVSGHPATISKDWILVDGKKLGKASLKGAWVLAPIINGEYAGAHSTILNEKNAFDFGLGTAQSDSKWFTSNYARTDLHEFFAELFASYMLGQAGAIQTKWLDRLLAANKK